MLLLIKLRKTYAYKVQVKHFTVNYWSKFFKVKINEKTLINDCKLSHNKSISTFRS